MSLMVEVKSILKDALQLSDVDTWDEQTVILGAIPEFDSMAIVTVLTMIEEHYGIDIEDDEISAEIFETFGGVMAFIDSKIES